jgi:hypothetical protein
MISSNEFRGTSFDASIYHWCTPAEYNAWAAAGRQDRSWVDVGPFFKMSEKSLCV